MERFEARFKMNYQRLYEIGKLLLAESDSEKLLHAAIDHAIEMSGAERGMLILFGGQGEIFFETARNLEKRDIENPKFEISRTIIGSVRETAKPICLRNALDEPAFRKSKSVDRLKILSVICLPLQYEGELFGVLYLDNRTVRGSFKPDTCAFLQEFADLISLSAYRALERKRLSNRVLDLERKLRQEYEFEALLGHSPQMVKVLELVSQVAETDAPVLIEGETGTGKELVARAIHRNSQRRDNPMVSINCGAIPENLLESELFGFEKGAFTGATKRRKGKFEQAEGGTIFLDEVDEMSQALQVKLLRILQWGEYSPLGSDLTCQCDVRIVAATKKPLNELVQKGIFRDDLYYRLNLIRIYIPPLRERKEDIPLLADYFFQSAKARLSKPAKKISPEVIDQLMEYDFPGNVRELENIINRAVILCKGPEIKIAHLPAEITQKHSTTKATLQPFKQAKQTILENFERSYLLKVLKTSGGNIKKAAQLAGMHEKNFHQKLKQYGIRAKDLK